MNLLRYGLPGRERHAMPDRGGWLRDLSQHIADFPRVALVPDSLVDLASTDPECLPLIGGNFRFGEQPSRDDHEPTDD